MNEQTINPIKYIGEVSMERVERHLKIITRSEEVVLGNWSNVTGKEVLVKDNESNGSYMPLWFLMLLKYTGHEENSAEMVKWD